MGTYPNATEADTHITIDVTVEELAAFVDWSEPSFRSRKGLAPAVSSFIELMFDSLSNYQISGEREFLLADRRQKPEGPVRLSDYMRSSDAQP